MEIVTTMLTSAMGQNIAGINTITISTMFMNVLDDNDNNNNNRKNNKSATCFTLNTAPQPRLRDNVERARVDHGLRLHGCLRIAAAKKGFTFDDSRSTVRCLRACSKTICVCLRQSSLYVIASKQLVTQARA